MLRTNKNQLNIFAHEIIANGGEGVILREPASVYLPGRAMSLIKLKSTLSDTEGMVVALDDRNNVYLSLPNGITFSVSRENILIAAPRIGQIVTFAYERRTRTDLPSNPVIIKLREDLEWKDISNSPKRFTTDYEKSRESRVSLIDPEITERTKKYLESYAITNKMDPHDPDTWYTLAAPALQQFQSGQLILSKFNGSYYHALKYLLPQLKFHKSSFPETQSRRAFFESYAWSQNFDYRVPENWYSQSRKKIMSFEGGLNILSNYGGSLSRALKELFPEIRFEAKKFEKKKLWRNMHSRRQFFETYAKENWFDPLIRENWYIQSRKHINSKKGAVKVLAFHKNSVYTALLDLFPDIGLDRTKFKDPWKDSKNRRCFFEQYATKFGFDPKDPHAWTPEHRKRILSLSGNARASEP